MREEKKALILTQAKKVFQKQGFANVTMQDIIDASNISRGGIYLYFDSVESIFKEVINQREQSTTDLIKKDIADEKSFSNLINDYLDKQKQRLLNMDESLLRAVYEYHFTHKSPEDINFRKQQVEIIRNNLALMLEVGVREKKIEAKLVPELSDQMMFIIEGLSVYALLGGLKEETIDQQFMILKKQLSKDLI